MDMLVMDEFKKLAMAGEARTNEYVCGAPFEMEIILDYTGLRGSGSNIYHSFVYQLPRWAYTVRKVDEWLEVNPAYAEFYNITIAQKQKLEAAIKLGLTSASQAVVDYELLAHDSRRYREIIDYFKERDEHVLRSLFVDRVDAYTGEGYSMVTMARRWPTIITDFIRMKSEWTDPKTVPEGKQVNKIMQELDVSQAEATVLKTKSQLYKEWKALFFPVVKERYARIANMMNSRKRSIEEYKNWLKPYISQYKRIKESGEKFPSEFLSDATITPGFGQSQAITGVKLWAWKPFIVAEKGRPEKVREKIGRGFVIDPYDGVVKTWIPRLEEKYGVKITDKVVRDLLTSATTKTSTTYTKQMEENELYYILFDINVFLSLLRTPPPEGLETDNLMFIPVKAWVMSQNALLLHLLEIWARERNLEKYINELIGSQELEDEIRARVEKEFEKQKKEKKRPLEPLKKYGGKVKGGSGRVFYLFVKKGPYETVFEERVSKMYMRNAGAQYGQIVGFLKAKMGIG